MVVSTVARGRRAGGGGRPGAGAGGPAVPGPAGRGVHPLPAQARMLPEGARGAPQGAQGSRLLLLAAGQSDRQCYPYNFRFRKHGLSFSIKPNVQYQGYAAMCKSCVS